jgi:ABC-type Fe3+ transport system substrate-binding protein
MRTDRRAMGFAAAAIFVLGLGAETAFAADDWQEGAGPDWQKVLDSARKEGKVVVAPAFGALAEPMGAAFKRDTGITAEFLTGTIGDLYTRVAREAKADNTTVDISISGGIQLALLREGYLVPIKPQFMLPKVLDPKSWIGGKMEWMDTAQSYMFEGSNWVHGWPLINSKLVDPASLKSWKDLLKPEFKGKIAADDPRVAGAGQAAAAYLATVFGIDFVKALYVGQNVTYTRDSRQLVEWVARGTYAVALGAIQAPIESFRSQGMTQLDVPSLADGPGSVLGGFSVLTQTKGVPHPDATRVFINWYASRPGQEVYTRTTLEPSTRTDVKVDVVPDYVVPKPGVTYFDQYKQDWYVNTRPKVSAAIIEALGGR